MGLKRLREEFMLLMRIQVMTLLVFVVFSGILLIAGLGGMHPFRLLWLVGVICLAVDGVVTVMAISKPDKISKKEDQGAA